MLRQAHVSDAVKDRKLADLVRKLAREDIKHDPIIDTETSLDYFNAAVENDDLPTQRVSEVYRKAVTEVGLASGDS